MGHSFQPENIPLRAVENPDVMSGDEFSSGMWGSPSIEEDDQMNWALTSGNKMNGI
jgi:hypothetical protein